MRASRSTKHGATRIKHTLHQQAMPVEGVQCQRYIMLTQHLNTPVLCKRRQAKASSHECHGCSHTNVAGHEQLLATSSLNQAGGDQCAQHVGSTDSSRCQSTRSNASLPAQSRRSSSTKVLPMHGEERSQINVTTWLTLITIMQNKLNGMFDKQAVVLLQCTELLISVPKLWEVVGKRCLPA